MVDLFQNKYRIASARLLNWDYGSNATYFVTICTLNRENYFGKITQGKMQLSEIGEIVKSEWLKTAEIRPDMNLELDAFVVMPNHFHALITIGENKYNNPGRDAMHGVSTTMHGVSTAPEKPKQEYKNQFGRQSKNLASIIRGFKSAVTTKARQIHADFAWQARFHDHIIRNDKSFQTISDYIINNPANWSSDKFYSPD